MNRKVELYFEDAYPNLEDRWYATARDNLDVELACGIGKTAPEALEKLGAELVKIRDRKREVKRGRS